MIEKTEPWKKPINPIKIFKKPTGSVRFRFISLKPKKPNQTQTQTKKNRAKQEKTEPKSSQTGFCPKKPNWTETSRFELVSVFFLKKILFGYFFFIKTEPNRK